jgi:hypothetical protein
MPTGNLRPGNVIMHIFGDKDLDVGHCKAKASAVMEFVARKIHNIASGKAGGTYWNRIMCKEFFGNHPEAVIQQATINLDS